MRTMANNSLIKPWIQYLKGLQIANLRPDPESGRLVYKRPVTTDDLTEFLDVKTDSSSEDIASAIQRVISGKEQSGDQEMPAVDESSLSETDVEAVFNILTAPAAPAQPLPPSDEQKQENLRKIKRLIRDTMTGSQRKSFWRMLRDQGSISENKIDSASTKSVLKTAVNVRNSPTGLGRIFTGLRKDKIELGDLHQAWKDMGYPDDTRDISRLLSGHGFSDKEIKNVFLKVFGSSGTGKGAEPDFTTRQEELQKIATYAKDAGISRELISFLESEYGFTESHDNSRIFADDIRKIFTEVVGEGRSSRQDLIKIQDNTRLGRNRK